jgi:hypothetical protein
MGPGRQALPQRSRRDAEKVCHRVELVLADDVDVERLIAGAGSEFDVSEEKNRSLGPILETFLFVQQARAFVPRKSFQPGLTFVSKAGWCSPERSTG